MLTNPLFIGRIRHRDKEHAGLHPPIVDPDLWEAVQQRLAANRRERSPDRPSQDPSPLAGRAFDPDGRKMRPSHASRKGRRYRYYVSETLVDDGVAHGARGWRIPALELEAAVGHAVAAKLREPEFQAHLLGPSTTGAPPAAIVPRLLELADRLAAPASPAGRDLLRRTITRVDLTETELRAEAGFEQLGEAGGSVADLAMQELPAFRVAAPLRLQRRGPALRIVLGGAAAPTPAPDPMLIRTLIEARCRTADYLDPTRALTVSDIAHREAADVGDVSRSLQLAFLAPDLVERILDGTQPVALTAERLKRLDVPLLWKDQRAMLG